MYSKRQYDMGLRTGKLLSWLLQLKMPIADLPQAVNLLFLLRNLAFTERYRLVSLLVENFKSPCHRQLLLGCKFLEKY